MLLQAAESAVHPASLVAAPAGGAREEGASALCGPSALSDPNLDKGKEEASPLCNPGCKPRASAVPSSGPADCTAMLRRAQMGAAAGSPEVAVPRGGDAAVGSAASGGDLSGHLAEMSTAAADGSNHLNLELPDGLIEYRKDQAGPALGCGGPRFSPILPHGVTLSVAATIPPAPAFSVADPPMHATC